VEQVFDIEISETRRAVLVRFRGELSESDFAPLDALALNRHGSDQYDCVFDLTSVEKVDLASEFISKRGELPQIFRDRQRIYVVPQDDLKLLVRLYSAYQTGQGWRPPVIVEKLAEAFEILGVSPSDFRAVPKSPAEGDGSRSA
jgi:hypothetical protein